MIMYSLNVAYTYMYYKSFHITVLSSYYKLSIKFNKISNFTIIHWEKRLTKSFLTPLTLNYVQVSRKLTGLGGSEVWSGWREVTAWRAL